MLRVLKSEGFASITEVIVTSVVFLIAAAGIMTSISMVQPQSLNSFKRLEAAHIGKTIIDELYANMTVAKWGNSSGNYATSVLYNRTEGDYSVLYSFEEAAGYPAGLAPRKLIMNITFSDL
jgi:hypothetical protein